MKKQTYIQNICSIIFAQSVDTRKYVRYNSGNQEQMFATHVRVFVFIVNDITNFCFRLLQEPYTVAPARPKTKFPVSLPIKFTQNHFTTGMDSHIVINQINDQCQRNGQYRRGV